jgi:hypothetical protein
MSVVLPKELAYTPSLPTIPAGTTSKEIVLAPVNGSSFADGALVQFDLGQAGYLDPKSLYIRYRATQTNGSGAVNVCKIPAYTFLQRSEVIIGSTMVESINDYNVWCNLFADLQLDPAQRYGNGAAWGLNNTGETLESQDSGVMGNNGSIDVAAPLPNFLSACEKLVPLGMMPNVRLQLTFERLANIFAYQATNYPTAIIFSNVELCYTQIDFPGC